MEGMTAKADVGHGKVAAKWAAVAAALESRGCESP